MSVTHDGGKTFKNVGEDFKHVDNHAMWINPKTIPIGLLVVMEVYMKLLILEKNGILKRIYLLRSFTKLQLTMLNPFTIYTEVHRIISVLEAHQE